MTKRLVYIFLFILTFQSGLNAQTFNVSVDTMFLNIQDIARPASLVELTHAVKYGDRYYCFFNERGLYSLTRDTKYFLILSDKGEIENNIEVPAAISKTVYFDFFIRNDSMLAKTYMDHRSFYFDVNKLAWSQIGEVDDKVYEDARYAVMYLDFGEWGESTWFVDKQTQNEYVIGTFGTVINFLNGKYYLTTGTKIREIENPAALHSCAKDYYYQQVEQEKKFFEGSGSFTGSKVIYEDTTYSPWSFEDPAQFILTSFVSDNQLCQLYTDSNSTYVGRIENGKLLPVCKIGKKFRTFNWHYSYRGNNLSDGSRFLKFGEDRNTFGFIEIQNNNIHVRYLKHNMDSLQYLGSDGFEKVLALLIASPSGVSLEQIMSIETELGGTDMKTDRTGISHNGYYPEEYNSGHYKTKEFIKTENENIAQTTEYLYASADNVVKSVFIEWTQTKAYNQSNMFNAFYEDPGLSGRFMNKQNAIIKTVTEQMGKGPEKKNRENSCCIYSWTSDSGIEVVLYGSDDFEGTKEIRMIINLK